MLDWDRMTYYRVIWGYHGNELVYYARGTGQEPAECCALLQKLSTTVSDLRFNSKISGLTDDQFAEAIKGVNEFVASCVELTSIIDRLNCEFLEAQQEAEAQVKMAVDALDDGSE